MKAKIKEKIKNLYLKIVHIDDTPEKIGKGAAIGVVMAVFPTPFIGTFIAILIASICKWNKAAAIIGSLAALPWLSPIYWILSSVIGTFILGGDWYKLLLDIKKLYEIKGIGVVMYIIKEGIIAYLIGNIILCAISGWFTYIIVSKTVINHRKKTLVK